MLQEIHEPNIIQTGINAKLSCRSVQAAIIFPNRQCKTAKPIDVQITVLIKIIDLVLEHTCENFWMLLDFRDTYPRKHVDKTPTIKYGQASNREHKE